MSALYEELCLVIGRDAAERLVAAHGGRDLRIPTRFDPSASAPAAALAAVIGADRTEQLVRHYGGCVLYVPTNSRVAVRAIVAQAVALAVQGVPRHKILDAVRHPDGRAMTSRWLRYVLAHARAQGTLPAAERPRQHSGVKAPPPPPPPAEDALPSSSLRPNAPTHRTTPCPE